MFRDITTAIGSNPPGRYTGVAVADLDFDERLEFVLGGYDCPNRVLKCVGTQLRDAAPPQIAETGCQTGALAAGDVDGDGREELYIANLKPPPNQERSPDRLLKAHPDGNWEDLFARTENRQTPNDSAARSVAAIDRRGVGRYGFLVANNNQPLRLYELGAAGLLADLAPALGVARSARVRGILTLPIFAEHPDIICLNDSGPNLVFRNRGDGTFEECAGELGLADADERGRAIVAIDADADAKLDLCWGNWEGAHRVMLRQPDEAWKNRATPGLAFPSVVQTVVAADFDNDGRDELFFHNCGESNRLFRALGTDAEIEMLDPGEALDSSGLGTGAAVCDIDGDGILELLIARGEGEAQPLGLFKARSAEGNNWLRVRPLTRYGAPARGAIVYAESGGRVSVKGVCGGSGYRCQMEPVAHFGLGPNGRADRVQVAWPDGAAVMLLNPRTNRTITVPYPRG